MGFNLPGDKCYGLKSPPLPQLTAAFSKRAVSLTLHSRGPQARSVGCPVSTLGRPREGVDTPQPPGYSPRPQAAVATSEGRRPTLCAAQAWCLRPRQRSEGEAAGTRTPPPDPAALNDASTLSSGGASSRTALCRSSVMLGTPGRRHPGRAARWPRRSAQRARPLRGPERLAAPQCLAQPLQPRR